jgi:hypothetical protein
MNPSDPASLDEISPDEVEHLRRQLGPLHPEQIRIWRAMSPAQRIGVACQAYHLVLEAIRAVERARYPDLSAEEFNWRVIRRLHGDPTLGR